MHCIEGYNAVYVHADVTVMWAEMNFRGICVMDPKATVIKLSELVRPQFFIVSTCLKGIKRSKGIKLNNI